MKAITIWQPWASLVAVGAKKYETRGWKTNYRGPIAIHAAARDPFKSALGCGVYGEWGDAVLKALCPGWNPVAYSIEDELKDLPIGAIIATAELMGCWEISSDPEGPFLCVEWDGKNGDHELIIRDAEILFGDWRPGRYAWELANAQMLPEPIPAKGKQGLWEWTPEVTP